MGNLSIASLAKYLSTSALGLYNLSNEAQVLKNKYVSRIFFVLLLVLILIL
jgi:hypothetical protein